MNAGFTLVGGPPPMAGVGPWRAPPLSFAVVAEPVWRVDLDARIDTAIADVARCASAVQAVPERLERVLRAGPVSYDVAALPSAERGLLAALNADAMGAVSFDGGVGQQIRTGLEAIAEFLTRLAVVETRQDGRLVGRTRIGLGGRADTLIDGLLTPKDARAHARAVALVVQSKDAWLRILALVTGAARHLAVAATNPFAALRALPRAWAFVKAILEEAGALPALA